MEIRRGLPSDYDVMLNHVVQSFREANPGHLRFEHLFPDVISASPEMMGYWRFAFIDGEMAAGIELIPRHIKIGDSEFTSGGIGNVHCWQKYRQTGCFSALLNRIIEDMNQEGWGLGLLGGDRTRYGNYGWEPAGEVRRFNVSSRTVRFENQEPAPSVTAFRDYTGDDEDAKKMWQAHLEKNVRCTRPTLEKFKLALARPGSVTYINETDDEGFAYVTVRNG
ncbi:MAG: GNAT family N-acetyltransferase, partial [Victivallales bacterium]|nr:GNAT family N-acetyltransferase [Victivallales bacterium]